MKILYKKHQTTRKPPKNIKKEDLPLFQQEFTKEIRDSHVLKLSKVFLLNDNIVEVKNKINYKEYTQISKLPLKLKLKRLLRWFLINTSKKRTIENGVWIIDNWSNEYFHWLTDALPRLIASESVDSNVPILLPESFKSVNYITESLRIFGRDIIFYNPSQKIEVNRLILPSYTANTGNYNKLIINNLRERFIHRFKNSENRKIYVSRKKARTRKITNEDELQKLLESFGYEIHFFEDYSFQKQVKIMSETKSLIGLHGAGLTNMLFMPEGGQVLELRNENDSINNCYFTLASDLNHSYYYQLNKGDKSETSDVNITVDLNEFKKNIELMNIESE